MLVLRLIMLVCGFIAMGIATGLFVVRELVLLGTSVIQGTALAPFLGAIGSMALTPIVVWAVVGGVLLGLAFLLSKGNAAGGRPILKSKGRTAAAVRPAGPRKFDRL